LIYDESQSIFVITQLTVIFLIIHLH